MWVDVRVYIAKGNKTPDFYAFDWLQWQYDTLSGIPAGPDGKLPGKGCRGVGDGERYLYMTKGNNTLEFLRYDIVTDSWRQMPDVPAGPSGKKVKGGTDLAYLEKNDTGYVYLLKGYKCEFYRYSVAAGRWETLPDAPAGTKGKWPDGSWLVHDGTGHLYGHKATYHDLCRYDIEAGAWSSQPLHGMPFINGLGKNKKSRAGGCAAWHDGSIYALKGNNTQELWRYYAARDSWVERETIPSFGSTGKRKKVKAGADMTSYEYGNIPAVLPVLKGGKTRELWLYESPELLPTDGCGPAGSTAGRESKPDSPSFVVTPNPVTSGFATARWAGTATPFPSEEMGGCTSPLTVRIFDISGRLVLHSSFVISNSSFSVDLRSLLRGVYVVRLDAGHLTATQKLIIMR